MKKSLSMFYGIVAIILWLIVISGSSLEPETNNKYLFIEILGAMIFTAVYFFVIRHKEESEVEK